jgi:hypothetical protein
LRSIAPSFIICNIMFCPVHFSAFSCIVFHSYMLPNDALRQSFNAISN